MAFELPWMPLYGNDFFMDEKVLVMSDAQKVTYMLLLWIQWREGSLPNDIDRLARLAQREPRRFKTRIWPALVSCFPCMNGDTSRLQNRRLERERAAKIALHCTYSERATKAAKTRWSEAKGDASSIPQAFLKQCLTMLPPRASGSESESESDNESSLRSDSCPELSLEPTASGPDESVIVIPLIPKDGEFGVTQAMIAEWAANYPGVDVKRELLRCRAWSQANPQNRKTRRGIMRHVNSWLSRAQDQGPPTMQRGRGTVNRGLFSAVKKEVNGDGQQSAT